MPQALFEQVCRIAVEYGEFDLVAICHDRPADPLGAGRSPRPGRSATTLTACACRSIRDLPEGRGLIGTALRSGQHVICNDVMQDQRTLPFGEALDAQPS